MKIIEQDLTKYSTIRTKSYTKYFCIVNNVNDLKAAFEFKFKNNLDYVILGNGSNILFAKEKYEKILFIKLSGEFDFFIIKNSIATIGAAYSLKMAGKTLIQNGYYDYIFFNLIPACVGGAVTQNAGTGPLEEISNVCVSVQLYDIISKKTVELINEDFKFEYRNSIIKTNPGQFIVLSAKFDLSNKSSDVENLVKIMKNRLSEKINREPSGYSFGSTFQNSNKPAWKYVKSILSKLEDSKGAFFSDKHANWIINNSSSGSDISLLIKKAQSIIKEDYNVNIKNEVRIVE